MMQIWICYYTNYNAAFGSAGERCMAAAVVAVEDSIADEFVARLRKSR